MSDPHEELSYVLPLKSEDRTLGDLADYLRWMSARADVVVVDGSSDEAFERHAVELGRHARHAPPDTDLEWVNGKVNGVTTGVRLAHCDRVIVADEDVRYDDAALRSVTRLLAGADLIRPQNYFWPLPWHALWDTARSLVNRTLSADWPGTLGVRRSFFMTMGGYNGDVLFENFELVGTVLAAGGKVATPLDVFVRRRPPSVRHFWSQRVRQAYDEFATPSRLILWLAITPAVCTTIAWKRSKRLWILACAATGLAEVGRRRGGGRRVFPARASWFAPAWLMERSVCSWIALAVRARNGGVPYSGRVIQRAATPRAILRRRVATGSAPPGSRLP